MVDQPNPSRTPDRTSLESWLVIGALAIALVVIPWALIVLPEARGLIGAVGFSMRDAYLVIPLVPAVGLGVIGVWTAIRARRSQ